MDDSIRIIETGDGSQSLYNPALRETYHSTHGALTESRHVFIQMGLDYLRSQGKQAIGILEVGLGTGLNAMLSIEQARIHKELHIDYHTLEPYPLSSEIIIGLTYPSLLSYDEAQTDFERVHEDTWGIPELIVENFSFTKHKVKVEELFTKERFDLIYFDAFAPNKQSEVWELEVLRNVVAHMASGGVLVTYCAKGQFKRDLAALGLEVETLEGPPGKKEMVRATK